MLAGPVAVVRSPWLNQIGQGTQVESLLASWYGGLHVIDLPEEGARSNDNDFSCLLASDGRPAFSVLVFPGGNDRRLWLSLSNPQRASDHIRAFVRRGGGFVGICAGMCLASQGYWDIEGRLPADRAERRPIFADFPGVFPCELLNLHRLRRIDLRWNDALVESHPMREALPASGELKGARFNDGNVVTEPAPRGTEFLLQYTHDEAWSADELDSHGSADVDPALHGSLAGGWASIAYVDPDNATAGRLCLDGWHPESIHTAHCHAWLRAAVEYADHRRQEVEAARAGQAVAPLAEEGSGVG